MYREEATPFQSANTCNNNRDLIKLTQFLFWFSTGLQPKIVHIVFNKPTEIYINQVLIHSFDEEELRCGDCLYRIK